MAGGGHKVNAPEQNILGLKQISPGAILPHDSRQWEVCRNSRNLHSFASPGGVVG
jgi:hypothetical protein